MQESDWSHKSDEPLFSFRLTALLLVKGGFFCKKKSKRSMLGFVFSQIIWGRRLGIFLGFDKILIGVRSRIIFDLQVWMSHGTHMSEWVTVHIWVNESRYTYEWMTYERMTSRIEMSRVTHTASGGLSLRFVVLRVVVLEMPRALFQPCFRELSTCHISQNCAVTLWRVRDVTRSYVWRNHMCDMTRFICVTWRIYVRVTCWRYDELYSRHISECFPLVK